MKTTFDITLPFFPGFYESILYNSDMDYYACENYVQYYNEENNTEYTCDDVNVNFEEYKNDIINSFIDAFRAYAPVIVKDIKLRKLWSPLQYNPWTNGGHTDEVDVTIELSEDWLVTMNEFIKENADWFDKKIKEDWTSYDGFMSFMENTMGGWIENLESMDERYIQETIGYMMQKEYGDTVSDDIVERVIEDVPFENYICLKEEYEDLVIKG